MMISLRPGMAMERDELVPSLSKSSTTAATSSLSAAFRVRGDGRNFFPAGYDKVPSAWNSSATKSTASAPSTSSAGIR